MESRLPHLASRRSRKVTKALWPFTPPMTEVAASQIGVRLGLWVQGFRIGGRVQGSVRRNPEADRGTLAREKLKVSFFEAYGPFCEDLSFKI